MCRLTQTFSGFPRAAMVGKQRLFAASYDDSHTRRVALDRGWFLSRCVAEIHIGSWLKESHFRTRQTKSRPTRRLGRTRSGPCHLHLLALTKTPHEWCHGPWRLAFCRSSPRTRRASAQSPRHSARKASKSAGGFHTSAFSPYHSCSASPLTRGRPAIS